MGATLPEKEVADRFSFHSIHFYSRAGHASQGRHRPSSRYYIAIKKPYNNSEDPQLSVCYWEGKSCKSYHNNMNICFPRRQNYPYSPLFHPSHWYPFFLHLTLIIQPTLPPPPIVTLPPTFTTPITRRSVPPTACLPGYGLAKYLNQTASSSGEGGGNCRLRSDGELNCIVPSIALGCTPYEESNFDVSGRLVR